MTDRLLQSFRAAARQADPAAAYRGVYEYTTVAGTVGGLGVPAIVDARPTDSSMPELVGLQCAVNAVITGTVIVTVVPVPGATIYVAFANGDPGKPFVILHPFTTVAVS